ncbi:hypothetical protein A9Q78_10655 [Methylophaga sp. 41_12_T18]|nr:hypothetical protein A9Q78_10655 [Methylophaga sp. 41_12_T18]
MVKLSCYVKQMPFWHFVSACSFLMSSVACLLFFSQYYFWPDQPNSQLLITSLISLSLTAVVIVFLTALFFEKYRTETKEIHLATRVFNDAHESIIIVDINNTIVDINPAFTLLSQFERSELIGKSIDLLISNSDKTKFYLDIWRSLNKKKHWKGEIYSRKKSGQLFVVRLTISTLVSDDADSIHYVCLVSDITQNKEQQKKLEFMAHYDELTKLPNRSFFTNRFEQAVLHSKNIKSLLAICFLDLDHFKPINDKYGHIIGDKLLIEVAERIKANIREDDTVSRIGGDEFVILLGNLASVDECEQLLTRIHTTLAQNYIIENISLSISASSGVTIYPSDDSDPDTLLRHADQAMYKAKISGRNRYQFFSTEDDQLAVQKHLQLQEIQQALINNEFCLYYQPKINMKTGHVFGAEALIRWQHPLKGLTPPSEFLPIIDGTDIEIDIGNWVIQTAINQLSSWKRMGLALEISINISSYHLQSPLFLAQLESALASQPSVDSEYLQIEILESSSLSNLATITAIISDCHNKLGISIALDDFGTGYSSLNHLRHLKAKVIKVDRSFVIHMLDNPSDYAIVDGVIGLANTFNREVIAEGVETTEHGLMLLLMGYEQAQGYGISRPLPAEQIPNWLKNYQANEEWLLYGSTNHSPESSHLKLLKISANQWLRHFKTNINAAPHEHMYWPIMEHNKCHCGTWLSRTRQENIFAEHQLNTLEQAHQTMHHLASELKFKYLAGEHEHVRQQLTQLESSLDDLTSLNFKRQPITLEQ